MVKVLFVCLGNICRSPMAEAIFRDMVEKEGLSEKIQIDSAATSSWEHGNPVHSGTRKELAKIGIGVEGMYSRILNDDDLEVDYIVGMDDSNIENIKKTREGKTNIIVAHRISAVRHADKIVVLDNGKILNFGTHDELLEKCPWYKQLDEYQNKEVEDDEE